MNKLAILEPQDFNPKVIDLLSNHFDIVYGLDFTASGFFCRFNYSLDREFLKQFSDLRFICSPTTGHTHIDEEYCKQSNLDITEFKDCAPTANGNIDEVLIPIIPKSIMNIVAKKASDENGTYLLTGGMLMKSLSDVTKKEYTEDHFFSSMTFRQLTSGRPPVNHQMVN